MGNLGLAFLRQAIRERFDRSQAFFALVPWELRLTVFSTRCPQKKRADGNANGVLTSGTRIGRIVRCRIGMLEADYDRSIILVTTVIGSCSKLASAAERS